PSSTATQTRGSTPASVVPIIIGTISGLLMLALVTFALRFYSRKRRSRAQRSLDIDPFPTRLPEAKVFPPESDGTASQRLKQPDINQDDIATRDLGHNPDTKVDPLPLVHLQYTENTISATPPVENGLEGPSVARTTTSRPELEMLQTDELLDAR
ncbi:hypothetical protein AAF712_015964, partial [Marasmius tenuissimus]